MKKTKYKKNNRVNIDAILKHLRLIQKSKVFPAKMGIVSIETKLLECRLGFLNEKLIPTSEDIRIKEE